MVGLWLTSFQRECVKTIFLHAAGWEIQPDNFFKLNRRKIREAYRAGKLPEIGKAVRTEESGDLLTEEIRAFFAKALHKELSEIPADADFFSELGGSSLDYFGMMGEIRTHYGIDFPFTSGNAFFSVNGVAAFIREGQRK